MSACEMVSPRHPDDERADAACPRSAVATVVDSGTRVCLECAVSMDREAHAVTYDADGDATSHRLVTAVEYDAIEISRTAPFSRLKCTTTLLPRRVGDAGAQLRCALVDGELLVDADSCVASMARGASAQAIADTIASARRGFERVLRGVTGHIHIHAPDPDATEES